VLRLRQNALGSLPPRFLAGLPRLRELDLSDNELAALPAGLLADTRALKLLLLGGNRLEALPATLFHSTPQLSFLGLSRNRLGTVGWQRLALPQLQTLQLTGNGLAALAKGSLEGMPELRELWLDQNAIEIVEREVFVGLGKLTKLLLQQNSLVEIEMAAFDQLYALRILELWGNRLHRFPVGMTLALAQLEVVSFWQNPLSCKPILRTSQGSDLTQQQLSLPECLPIGCARHLKEALSSPPQDSGLGADIHARAVTKAMQLLRPDVSVALDVANQHAGIYVAYAGGVRCWCLGTPACFVLHGQPEDRGKERYLGSVAWFSKAHDDFASGSPAQAASSVEPGVGTVQALDHDDGRVGLTLAAGLGLGLVVMAAAGLVAGVVLVVRRRSVRRAGKFERLPSLAGSVELATLKAQLGHVPAGAEQQALKETAAWMLDGETRGVLGFAGKGRTASVAS